MEKITHAVVGIFDSEFDSLGAFDALLETGLTRHQVHLSDRGNSNRSFIAHENDGHASRVLQFFKTLLGNDREAEKYAQVALDSGAVITVLAASEDEARDAVRIMDQNGAINVNERAAELNISNPAATEAGKRVAGQIIIDEEDPATPGLGSNRSLEVHQKSRIVPWKSERAEVLKEQLLDATKFW